LIYEVKKEETKRGKIFIKGMNYMKIELLRPTLEMEEMHYDFIREWDEAKENIVPYAARLLDMDYKTWLENNYKFEETCPDGFVPAHTLFLVEDNKRILLNYGGHIGYGIRPSERKKGYASLMLSLALSKAKELGINKALITCDKDNLGSARTIMKNGGVLENEVVEGDKITQRYWIEL